MSEHHKFGPSTLENYDPRSGGCSSFQPGPGGEAAEVGSTKHLALLPGNEEVLEGDSVALEQVDRVKEFIEAQKLPGSTEYRELTLKDDLFFGTLDYLGIVGTRGLIVDAKFGAWSVTPAKRNLQGIGYVVLAFHAYPQLKRIRIIFFMARDGTFSEATFYRYRLLELETRLHRIVGRATRIAEQGPRGPDDFHPDAVNCSFCVRLNCPARLAMCSALVTQWTGKAVNLAHLDLFKLSLPELSALKRLSIVFKNFASAIDSEAKRRAFDEGAIVEGYEIREKSGPRRILGAAQIAQAAQIADSEWNTLVGTNNETWKKYILEAVELSVGDLEKTLCKLGPRGRSTAVKNKVIEELEKAGLISANPVFSLLAIRE